MDLINQTLLENIKNSIDLFLRAKSRISQTRQFLLNDKVNITANYYDSSSISVATTSGSIAGTITVPAKSSLVILDKSNALYLEENKAIGAIAGTAAKLTVICTYEDIG